MTWVANLNPNSTEQPCFNLSSNCITNTEAIAWLLGEIQDGDPMLWAELCCKVEANAASQTPVLLTWFITQRWSTSTLILISMSSQELAPIVVSGCSVLSGLGGSTRCMGMITRWGK
jgi:hypothetical protein